MQILLTTGHTRFFSFELKTPCVRVLVYPGPSASTWVWGCARLQTSKRQHNGFVLYGPRRCFGDLRPVTAVPGCAPVSSTAEVLGVGSLVSLPQRGWASHAVVVRGRSPEVVALGCLTPLKKYPRGPG